ncbi:MAG: aldehyde dehydrogenase family protein [Acidobacteriota bacterium]
MFIPALIGRGPAGYTSLDRQKVLGFDGSLVTEATLTPAVLVNQIARQASPGLRALPIRSLLDILAKAADIFEKGQPDGLAPEAYVRNASLTSGLPLTITRNQTLGIYPPALRMLGRFVEVQSPGGLDVFDTGWYEAGGIRIGLAPRGRNVGFVMPGNHPSTHFLWLLALAMKVPVVVRPSVDDLFTPYRLVTSFLEAGLPEDAVAFVPGGHELVDVIVQTCSLSVLFGTQQLADRYASNRNVRIHGPGRSKVIVPAGADFDKTVTLISRLVMDDAGRGCINGSAVVVEGDAGQMAAAVAKALSAVPNQSPLAEGAQLGAVRPNEAAAYSGLIDSRLGGGARELTPGRDARVVTTDGVTLMRPTVVQVDSFEHPLFGMELPFPFVVFASAPRADLVRAASHSLAVVVAGQNEALMQELLLEPTVDKVFGGGALSTEFDPREPHEGYLLDFLYQKKAVRIGPPALAMSASAR